MRSRWATSPGRSVSMSSADEARPLNYEGPCVTLKNRPLVVLKAPAWWRLCWSVAEIALWFPDHEELTYSANSGRDGLHQIYPYPAMIAPALARELVRDQLSRSPEATIIDPFCGAGTVLLEASRQGSTAIGMDINPLAVLVARAKAGKVSGPELRRSLRCVLAALSKAPGQGGPATRRPPRQVRRWYVAQDLGWLCRIKAAVALVSEASTRELLWLGLARVARDCSLNSKRTVKLYRDLSMTQRVAARPVSLFASRVEQLATALEYETKEYTARAKATVLVGDSRTAEFPATSGETVLITSPPYGDNHTTMAYGQFSELPLRFIDNTDISPEFGELRSGPMRELDTQSLGGSSRRIEPHERLSPLTPAAARAIARVAENSSISSRRMHRFVAGLYDALSNCVRQTAPAEVVLVTGNRRTGGHIFPLDTIVCEHMLTLGYSIEGRASRSIVGRTQPSRNSSGRLMTKELIQRFTA